jgi:signal transduction histidine kinase
MSWINWVYLGVGLGLGAGSGWLFARSKQPTVSLLAPQEAEQDVPVLQQLKQTQLAYQLAHQMSQFKAGFLARTSHELRSPLNSLIGVHQLILSDLCDDPGEERQFVAQAYASALKLMKLMDEILDVARTEHATNHLEIQPLQLAHVLQKVYNLTHLLAANSNFPLQVSLPDPEIYILADPHWLQQVLVNLLDTCISQMNQGSICVSTQLTAAPESVHIWLDVQLPAHTWSDPVDLMEYGNKATDYSDCFLPLEHTLKQPVNKYAAPSPGLKLLLSQTLLELMQGRLELLPVPTDADESHSRLQITIPLVIPETASLGQEGN